uniref:Uncharacterized protein n=1 Tax=Fagus sylvatica TaxID=28930 RepID=A0A2N9HWL1_FAGSY
MNEFIREQLEISEDAKEQLEETLAEAREQLETEQAERTRVQDELDSLRSYTQALVDPATGRPQDIVALRRALDASEEALTSARTSMGVMRVQISVLQEGFPVVTALQINQGGRARLAQRHHARRMTVLRELWYCASQCLRLPRQLSAILLDFSCAYSLFDPIFEGQFWRSSGTQNGSCRHIVGKLSTSSFQRYESLRESEFGRGSYGSRKSGYRSCFRALFPVKIPIKRGMLSANREFHDVAGVIIFPTHPGSRINLLRAGKTLRAKAAVREKNAFAPSAFFLKILSQFARIFDLAPDVPDSRESELGLVRYGPASRGPTGVFLVRLRAVFRSEDSGLTDKILAIREFRLDAMSCICVRRFNGNLVNAQCLERVVLGFERYNGLAQGVPYSEIQLSTLFFTRTVRLDGRSNLGIEKAVYLRFASLGSQDMICERRPLERSLCQGFWPQLSSFLVRFRPVKYRIEALDYVLSELVKEVVSSIPAFWSGQQVRSNFGQTWSTLVGIWSKLSKLWEMYPGPRFEGFWARWTLVGLGTARSNLGQTSVNPGQTWSTLVKLGQPWSNLGKCVPDLLLREYLMTSQASLDQAGLVRAASFCVPTPEKIPWGKNGVMTNGT